MSTVSYNSGSEGPRHDPYHYDEVTIDRKNGDVVTIHMGLAAWCKVKRHGKTVFQVDGETAAQTLFEWYAGITFHKAIGLQYTLFRRRVKYHACGTRFLKSVSGYPGESFTICDNCGAHLDYHFNRSVVE